MERGHNALTFSKGEKGWHKSASSTLTCVCANGILKSVSARLLGPSVQAQNWTDTAGPLAIKTATSQAVTKAEPQLITGGKFLCVCIFMAHAKSVRVYRDIIKEQKGSATPQVAELEYSLLVMSYLNSESILPGITQKCNSGQHWQKKSPALSASVPRDSPRGAAAGSVLGNHFLPQYESAKAIIPL